MNPTNKIKKGDLVRLENCDKPGFQGCMMEVTEVRPFGVIGCLLVPLMKNPKPRQIFYRAAWCEIELISEKD